MSKDKQQQQPPDRPAIQDYLVRLNGEILLGCSEQAFENGFSRIHLLVDAYRCRFECERMAKAAEAKGDTAMASWHYSQAAAWEKFGWQVLRVGDFPFEDFGAWDFVDALCDQLTDCGYDVEAVRALLADKFDADKPPMPAPPYLPESPIPTPQAPPLGLFHPYVGLN